MSQSVKADDTYRALADRRRSLRFVEEVLNEDDVADQGQAHLFVRDLKLGIVPRGTSSRTDKPSVDVEPYSPENEDWIRGLLGDYRAHRPGLEGIYVDFVEDVAYDLGVRGEARYEIIQSEPTQGNRRARATLLRVQPSRLLRLPTRYLQLVPKSANTETGRRRASIPSRCLWRFTLPSQLGSRHSHRRRIQRLAALKPNAPTFVFDAGLGASTITPYDAARYHRAYDRRAEALLRNWGTVMSMPQLKDTSEYYYIRRRIQWRHSQALVREQILCQLNQLLDQRLQGRVRILVRGIPTACEIAEAGARLDRGEIGFSAAMDVIGV